jgi:hypothetical protein
MSEELIMKEPASMLIDQAGNTFITFRMGLVVESVDLAIQLIDDNGQVIDSIPYNIAEEFPDDNERDIVVMLPSAERVLRVSLVATPMGREVVCFVSFAPAGEAVEVPTAEPSIGEDLTQDDSAISVFENSTNDEVQGVSDEARGPMLTFLAVAGGALVVIGAIAAIVYFRKKSAAEKAPMPTAPTSPENLKQDDTA